MPFSATVWVVLHSSSAFFFWSTLVRVVLHPWFPVSTLVRVVLNSCFHISQSCLSCPEFLFPPQCELSCTAALHFFSWSTLVRVVLHPWFPVSTLVRVVLNSCFHISQSCLHSCRAVLNSFFRHSESCPAQQWGCPAQKSEMSCTPVELS
jgi:hypothetical protein